MQIRVNNHDKVDLPAMGLLGLLVPSSEITNIEYLDGRIPLNIQATVYHAERVQFLHMETMGYVARVFQKAYPKWGKPHEYYSLGEKHVIGLIDLILKFQDMKKPIAVVHPESGLHPKTVLALTDVLLDLAVRGADEDMKFEILTRKADIRW